MSPLRTIWHLATRFFGVIFSRPLGPAEQAWVHNTLKPAEAELFWAQQIADQRHALQVATRVAAVAGRDRGPLAAALLHDVGKRHSRLGPVSRSLATAAGALHLPMPETWRLYLDHGHLGAQDLQGIDAEPLSVAFASGDRTAEQEMLALLRSADDGLLKEPGISMARNTIPPEVK